jgi:hypothetical protein
MLTWLHETVATSALALAPNNAGAKDVGNGKGQQFTTGGCVANADCRSACCAEINKSGVGICSAEGAQFQNGKQGESNLCRQWMQQYCLPLGAECPHMVTGLLIYQQKGVALWTPTLLLPSLLPRLRSRSRAFN